jgi:lactate permease
LHRRKSLLPSALSLIRKPGIHPMLWAVAYSQDLNPATPLTVLATIITAVVVLPVLILMHRGKIPGIPGLIVVFLTPFLAWGGIALFAPASSLPTFSPTMHRIVSTVLAGMPVLILFYLLVGRRWLASGAGAAGSAVAILLAGFVCGMPFEMAGWAFVHGAVFGLLPIGWTVFAAMLLYNMTVETGQFAIIRRSIAGLSGDARVQAVLIGFCFGAFLEGAAGAGSPVAICGAMLVGLGFPPLRAAVICLIANTSPVCYGGLGVPVLTLSSVTGISADRISIMCGHQLPFLSCLIPLYMVKVMCTWRQTLAIWPALVMGGGSFAVFQFFFATAHAYGLPPIWPLTDIAGSALSMITLALFLKFVWKPKDEWRFSANQAGAGQTAEPAKPQDPHVAEAVEQVSLLFGGEHPGQVQDRLTARRVIVAWSPWIIMAVLLVVSGALRVEEKTGPLNLGIVKSYYVPPVPTLHNETERAYQLQKPVPVEGLSAIGGMAGTEAVLAQGDIVQQGPGGPRLREREAAEFKLAWLTAPGTPVFLAALLSMLLLRMNRAQVARVFRKTFFQMKVPIPTIACMLGLSYVTKYAGMDATLGVAFAGTGVFYPYFAAMLGWLGCFLTGTDAGSNALFGSLQKITATEVYAAHSAGAMSNLTEAEAQTLICTANSTGGVMGKMIDAQSICVATAGTNQIGKEADIFKAVIWHSVLLASIVGLMTAVQAYVYPFTRLVP